MAHIIDRQSPTPYYEQLFVIVRDRIAAGELAASERLPSEGDYCREFGLSRATVRQTLQKLETEGWVQRIPHRGVFVAAPEQSSGWTVEEGFLESQLRHGRTGISTHVNDARFVPAPSHVAEALELSAESRVFALERVRSLDGRAAMFSTNWFPESVGEVVADTPEVLDGTESLNGTLRSAGYLAAGAHRVIRAMRAPAAVTKELEVEPDSPVLRVRSLSWDQRGTRFDYYETWVLTDLIPLEVNVTAT